MINDGLSVNGFLYIKRFFKMCVYYNEILFMNIIVLVLFFYRLLVMIKKFSN